MLQAEKMIMDQEKDKSEKKKGFFARIIDKLDKKIEDKANKSSCCCSDQKKDSSCC